MKQAHEHGLAREGAEKSKSPHNRNVFQSLVAGVLNSNPSPILAGEPHQGHQLIDDPCSSAIIACE